MRQILKLLLRYWFAIAVILIVLTVNLMPERVVEWMRSKGLELAAIMPHAGKRETTGPASVSKLRKENYSLRETVRLLDSKVARLERELDSYHVFRNAFPDELSDFIPARVLLKRGLAAHRRSILIGCGSNDGVAAGMPVVTGRTLVGIVASVGSRCSWVQLVTDPAFRVVGRLAVSGDEGIVEGTCGRDCLVKMSYLRTSGAVKIGHPVLTAGTLGRYPCGLVIGAVTEEPSRPENGFKWVTVRPDLAVEALESVLVIRGYPSFDKLGRETAMNTEESKNK